MTNRRGAGFLNRGEGYDAALDPVVGSEIGKRRPAVIVSNDINNRYSDTVTVVPVTSAPSSRLRPYEVQLPRRIAGLTYDSRAKCNQVRTLDKRRLGNLRGALTEEYQVQLERALKIHLALS